MEKEKVGLIINDLNGGDFMFRIVSEEDYKIVTEYNPTTKVVHCGEEQNIFDVEKYNDWVCEYFNNDDKTLLEWFNQNYVPEKVNLSKYDIIGVLTLPSY